MTQLVLTRGIPASGKSTWARAWVATNPSKRMRVNRDDLRMMHCGAYVLDGALETAISASQAAQVLALLKAGFDVVVDDTNLTAKYIKDWYKVAWDAGAEIVIKDFPISLDDAIARNRARGDAGGHFVPEDVIRSFYSRFGGRKGLTPAPSVREVFPEVPRPYVAPEGKPEAILVDLDGTLAKMNGRSPFEWMRVGEDELVEHVANVVLSLAALGHVVIFMSGRDAVCREITHKWLERHKFVVDHLYMRAEGDQRKDSIVKYELFNQHVRDNFNIVGVFDDRNQVVEMWRRLGLTVFQVAEGDF